MGKASAIGLDIATTSVRAAEIRSGSSGPRLERIGQIALPVGAVVDGEVADPVAVAEALKELWKAVKFSTKNVAIGVANSRVVVRTVDIPWVQPSDLRATLPHVVADQIPMSVDESVLDLIPLRDYVADGKHMLQGLLVAASEEMLMKQVEAVQLAGLHPHTVDLGSFALLRAIGRADPLGMSPVTEAIVDVGARITSIVVHRGGRPQFVRMVLMGGNDVSDRLIEAYRITAVQAEELKRETVMGEPAAFGTAEPQPHELVGEVLQTLIDEIRSSLEYFVATSHDGPIERLVLTGGVARTRGFAYRLEDATDVKVSYATPLATMELGKTGLAPEQLAFLEPMASVPIGLALVGAS